MAALVDQPVVVFHVTTEASMAAIRDAQTRGQKLFAETCPQYLLLSATDLDKPGLEGAKWMFSPPARERADQEAIWRGVQNGTFQMVTSDHAPYRFDETGKLARGKDPDFKQIANGIPGIELRLPLLFSEGVAKGRIELERFVELACTNPARIYGLHPRKGTIAIGSDADIAIWDPDKTVLITDATTRDRAGYCPYAGMTVTGWPVTVLARGEVIVDRGELLAERGRGRFLPRAAGPAARPLGRLEPELDPERNFGANASRLSLGSGVRAGTTPCAPPVRLARRPLAAAAGLAAGRPRGLPGCGPWRQPSRASHGPGAAGADGRRVQADPGPGMPGHPRSDLPVRDLRQLADAGAGAGAGAGPGAQGRAPPPAAPKAGPLAADGAVRRARAAGSRLIFALLCPRLALVAGPGWSCDLSRRRAMVRPLAAAGLGSALLLAPHVVAAHVTLEHQEAFPNSSYKAVLRVPHGCEGKPTTAIRVQIPEGLIAVKPMPKPGWQLAVIKGKYDHPYEYEGSELTEGVKEVDWTGGDLADDFYDEFVFTGRLTDLAPDTVLSFPTVQECKGAVQRWIDIPAPGQDPDELAAPAPQLTIIEGEGEDAD